MVEALEQETIGATRISFIRPSASRGICTLASYTRKLKKYLEENECFFKKQGRGDHEKWYSPHTGIIFIVDGNIKSRHTANVVCKQAGLPKAF